MTDVSRANVAREPVSLGRVADILAPALSARRRLDARLVTGSNRCFFVSRSCRRIYVPFPLPGPAPSLRTLTCGIALQCSPTKEALAALPLHELRAAELAALSVVEGGAAVAWAVGKWPGLADEFKARLPDVEWADPELDAQKMVELALAMVRDGRPALAVPELLGRLPSDERARRSLRSIFRGRGRMQYSMRKTQNTMTPFSVPITGSGGARSKNVPPPPGGDDEPEVQAKRRVGIPYDEWNVHTKSYRRGHVSVMERTINVAAGPRIAPPPEVLRWFAKSPSRAWRGGMEDGTELDVDAYVDQHCVAVSGGTTDGRVYGMLDEGPRDVVTALLLDGSTSLGTDGGMHLRLQLECADALAGSLAAAKERHGVFVFTGNTRHRVEIQVLKGFDQIHAVLPGRAKLRADGYTRLGAPIRHLTRRLLDQPAERRILLSLGDGLPSDEGYEGRYAWGDVARAVEEAEEAGVLVYHIGIGRVRIDPLKECFGPQRSRRVSSARELPAVLAEVHEGLCSQ